MVERPFADGRHTLGNSDRSGGVHNISTIVSEGIVADLCHPVRVAFMRYRGRYRDVAGVSSHIRPSFHQVRHFHRQGFSIGDVVGNAVLLKSLDLRRLRP